MNDKPTEPQIQREARLEWVPLARMRVNPQAQREMNAAWVAKLAADFDLEEMGNPTVNHRDAWFNIIDGQHRIAALKQWLGTAWNGQQVQCWTYENLSDEQEAEKFLRLQNRLGVLSFDAFRVAVNAGRPDESDIELIVRELGLTISRTKNGISATGTLKRVYRRGGPAVLTRTLLIIRDAYGETGFEAGVIDGIGLFCQRYNGDVQKERVVERLAKTAGGMSGLITRGNLLRKTTGNSRAQCVAAAVTEIVNRGPGKKLPSWWKAHAGDPS